MEQHKAIRLGLTETELRPLAAQVIEPAAALTWLAHVGTQFEPLGAPLFAGPASSFFAAEPGLAALETAALSPEALAAACVHASALAY